MSIQFACDCGEPLAAREEHAGRSVRCTSCNTVVLVPSPDDYSEDLNSPPPAAIQSERPWTRAPRQRDETSRERDPYGESDGVRPRPLKKSGGAGVLLLGGLLVLAIGGGVVYYLFVHGKGPSPDFDLVPRDAQAIITFRVAEAMKNDLGKQAWEAMKNAPESKLKDIESKSGLTADDVERVTIVGADIEHEVYWVLVQTSKPYDRARVLEAVGKTQEKTHQGKTYLYDQTRDLGVFFPGERFLVFGTEPGIKRGLEQPAKAKSGDLDESLILASNTKSHFFTSFNIKALAPLVARQQGPAALQGVEDLKAFWLNSTLGNRVEFEMGFETTSRGRARQVVADMEAGLVQARASLPMLKMMGRQNLGGLNQDNATLLMDIAEKLLTRLSVKHDGSSVVVSTALDDKDVKATVEMLSDLGRKAVEEAAKEPAPE